MLLQLHAGIVLQVLLCHTLFCTFLNGNRQCYNLAVEDYMTAQEETVCCGQSLMRKF